MQNTGQLLGGRQPHWKFIPVHQLQIMTICTKYQPVHIILIWNTTGLYAIFLALITEFGSVHIGIYVGYCQNSHYNSVLRLSENRSLTTAKPTVS